MDGVEKLQRMADLIRSRPDISSRELADALGYAEVKSIYYWLEKNGFTLRSFRRAVLRGEWPPGQNRLSLREREPYDLEGIPVVAAFRDGVPVLAEERFLPQAEGVRYALRWHTPLPEAGILADDILLLSDRPLRNGDLVLVEDGHGLSLYRYYCPNREILLVDPALPTRVLSAPLPPILAVVAGVVHPL